MKSSWRKCFDQRAPRYTSYPSALHFENTVTPKDFADKLDDVNLYDPLSLYVHVPFCRQLCWYCGCNMRVENYYERARDYVETLCLEIALVGQRLKGRGKTVSVHMGGGTPNYLLREDIGEILTCIEREIGLTDSANLSIELDPRLLRDCDIDHLSALGFRRFCLGVQDFDIGVQQAINRLQSYELIEACVSDMRASGIDDLAFDILYGLPHQSLETFDDTLDKVISLAPDRVSVFGYAHLPERMARQRMIDATALPDEQLRSQLAALSDERLITAGYVRVGFDHYAKPDNALARARLEGRLKRNFQGFTDDAAASQLGFGASAVSFIDGLYAQNERAIDKYARRVRQGEAPIARGLRRTKRETIVATAISDLLCKMSTNVSAVLRHSPPADAIKMCSLLDELEADGVIQWRGDMVEMTDGAHALARMVAMAMDPYARSQADFSAAV
ncbi:MAG: oxygen-independent coproporphyrinogen III oxidase [Pseudomonadota bacterium]